MDLKAKYDPGSLFQRAGRFARERDTSWTVSTESMEVARRLHPAFNRAFEHGTSELYELLDPEAEWIPITAVLEGNSYHGHDGVRQWIKDMRRDWEVFETRPEEYRDLDDDRVLILGTWRARGRSSGIELDFQQAAWLVHIKAGKLIRLHTFTDRERAFEAAGLR